MKKVKSSGAIEPFIELDIEQKDFKKITVGEIKAKVIFDEPAQFSQREFELDRWRRRPGSERFIENLARLASPLL
jgi:hypothetical protein